MKPMLASDYVEGKLRFPLIAQPKIDGVRALNIDGALYGRSLKQHRNRHTTEFYSVDKLAGLDGEMAAAHECDPELCRKTSSALSRIEGEPFTLWWVFDLITGDTSHLCYADRLSILEKRVLSLQQTNQSGPWHHLRVMPSIVCHNLSELLAKDDLWLEMGFEGTIVRDPNGKHKQGRSTVREGGLLRIKRFIEEEAVVIGIVEGQLNANEAQINELGNTFRSTHQENMIPNGLVGSLTCRNLKTNEVVTVSPGCMPHSARRHYFLNQSDLLGQVIKYKHFPKGVKDKPRFPTFQCIRAPEDM